MLFGFSAYVICFQNICNVFALTFSKVIRKCRFEVMVATSAAARWPQLSRQGQVVASRSSPSCPPCSRRGELSGPASSSPPPPWRSQSPPGPLIQSPSSCRESPEFGQCLKFYGDGIVTTIKRVPPLCWESGWASYWEATCRKGGLPLPRWSYATHWVGKMNDKNYLEFWTL